MNRQILDSLQSVMLRDLDKLASEIALYPDESSLWKFEKAIKNPAGNLCLHLCGNLQHFIGTVLGKTGYQRNRDNEFAATGIPRQQLLLEINRTKDALEKTLPGITEDQLLSEFPIQVFGHPMSTVFFLIHLSAHLGYHLGQVNYHRRLVA